MSLTIYGINPVLEALKAGRVRALRVSDPQSGRLRHVLQLARERGVPVQHVTADVLTRESRQGVHQGVVGDLDAPKVRGLEDLVRAAVAVPLIVVLDGVEDPHNLGAIIRTADAAGADGVVVQTRRSASLTGAAAKASAGALAHVPVVEVVNIARAIEDLKTAGVWVVGLAAEADTLYDAIDFTGPTALVVGAEDTGLRRLVRERCDFIASIPMAGRVGSLNVSVAAGIVLFEAVRQRRNGPSRPS